MLYVSKLSAIVRSDVCMFSVCSEVDQIILSKKFRRRNLSKCFRRSEIPMRNVEDEIPVGIMEEVRNSYANYVCRFPV